MATSFWGPVFGALHAFERDKIRYFFGRAMTGSILNWNITPVEKKSVIDGGSLDDQRELDLNDRVPCKLR